MMRSGKMAIVVGLLTAAVIGLAATTVDGARPLSPPPQKDHAPQLLFLGEKRPFRFRLDVRFHGRPFQHAWDEYMARWFEYADVNGDGVLSPDEAQRLPQARVFLTLLQGRFAFYEDKTVAPFAELDANKDGKVTLDEMKAYYRKGGFGPLLTQPDPDPGLGQVLTDALFHHLDRDRDGKLSQAELAAAEKSLAPLDTNNDDLITPEELVPGLDFGFGRPMPKRGPDAPPPLLSVINPDDPAEKQAAPLLAHYDKDKDGKLSRAEVGFEEATFQALDSNKDGFLDAAELARWLKRPSDLELAIPLSDLRPPRAATELALFFGAAEKEPPLIDVLTHSGSPSALAASLVKRDDGTRMLKSDRMLIEFRRERSPQELVNIILRELRDQFQAALRDRKTYLDKKEAKKNPFLKGLFPIIDRDGDGKATADEFSAFLTLLRQGATSFTVLTIADRGACLFELLDTNRDRRLSLRELRAAWQSVSAWDAKRDGSLARDEVPRHLQVSLCAGSPGRFRFPENEEDTLIAAARRKAAGPVWFRRMDVNGDGDVSRREWLGTEDEFRRIDLDGDGLISLEEALKAEKSLRKAAATAR
jgi:Ca2+-binding EF-hand superfamily protein